LKTLSKGQKTVNNLAERVSAALNRVATGYLNAAFEKKFPGARATDDGMEISEEAKGWLTEFRR
jgi:hypothetical protein